jgi:hypothetical protein
MYVVFPLRVLSAADDYVKLVGLCVYRVYFHPLSKYPGPVSYKLSGWPLLWQAYTGNRHIWHLKDHERYGRITTSLILTKLRCD